MVCTLQKNVIRKKFIKKYMRFIKRICKKLECLNCDYMESSEVARMEKRLQMLIALILFIPTVLASLGSDTFNQDQNIQIWCAVVSTYITIYIIIELSKGKINNLKGTILNYGIWINILAFIPYLLTVALYPGNEIISGFPLVTFFITLLIIFWSPIIVLMMLGLEFLFGQWLSHEN